MHTLFTLSLFFHFFGIGIYFGLSERRFTATGLSKVVLYLACVHAGLGLLIKAFPHIVDPRTGHEQETAN